MQYIKSPLNYVGGKYKLLPQIIPLFPKEIDTFYDLFCGGCNVGINVEAKKIVANDLLTPVIELFQIFKLNADNKKEIFETILQVIDVYDLGKDNKEEYLTLRRDYNSSQHRLKNAFMFYTLCCHSFSNMIRFNNKGEFNMPFGKRDFNMNLRQNLAMFLDKLNITNIEFTNKDFMQYLHHDFKPNDFVYLDPPYSDTTATYNENGGWGRKSDETLFGFLDRLHDMKIKFAMSNVLKTEWLIDWSRKYNVHKLNHNYKNCNYQKKDKDGKECEILITNY